MLPAPFQRPDRPLVLAHRGASRDAPENTLPAFELARTQGADGLELDVQLCATGEVVCFHDSTLGRITGRPGLLAETPWQTLRALDAGAFKDPRFAGTRIPLLAEVLSATPRDFLINIELKCEDPDDRGLSAAVCALVLDAGASHRVLLSSFNPLCLRRAKARAPGLPRAFLFHEDQGFLLRSGYAAPLVGALALHPEAVLATPSAVAAWKRRGYTVNCWTVDAPADAKRLFASGVSGVITNAPGDLLAALAASSR